MTNYIPLESSISLAFRKFLGLPPAKPTKAKPMWNASVSYGTYQNLKRQGVLA
jgi:hypothetical protein